MLLDANFANIFTVFFGLTIFVSLFSWFAYTKEKETNQKLIRIISNHSATEENYQERCLEFHSKSGSVYINSEDLTDFSVKLTQNN